MDRKSILVVDSEPSIQSMFKVILNKNSSLKSSKIFFADNKDQANQLLKDMKFHLVIVDEEIMNQKECQQKTKESSIIMMSSSDSNIDMKDDSNEHIIKPFSPKKISTLLEDVLNRKNISFLPKNNSHFLGIKGESSVIKKIFSQIEKISMYSNPILLKGESGTGKELFSRFIHDSSSRSQYPFVAVNCGAIHPNLIESELFGYVKGSFTGALGDRAGLFEASNKGTLFLDEIGELSLSMQSKLLRVLQEKKIRPIGSNVEKDIDFRIISATHRNLEDMIQKRLFREDLFHRINVMDIYIPALRERAEDIEAIAAYFLEKNKKKYNKQDLEFSEAAIEHLQSYSFPGNIRELENLIEKSTLLVETNIITEKDLFNNPPSKNQVKDNLIQFKIPEQGIDLSLTMAELEKFLINQSIIKFKGNRSKVAKHLQITPRCLKHKIYKYKLAK